MFLHSGLTMIVIKAFVVAVIIIFIYWSCGKNILAYFLDMV